MNSNKEHLQSLLVKHCLNGTRKYQKALYEQYSPALYTCCLFYTGDKTVSEELLQEVFLTVFKNLHSFNREEALEVWIERIFADAVLGHMNNKRLIVI